MSRQCRGYANSLPIVAPFISGLSTTSSILGATTIVTIFGENFRNYSTLYFGTTLINNVTYFSSGQLSFYVPAIATVGTYPIQVFNDTLASNIVFFTIDNSVGFWNQDPATGAITNNNATGGININGQLTINNPITLNYQPSLITNNTQLGYIITPTLLSSNTVTNNTEYAILLSYTVPKGVWLITGISGAQCATAINAINLYLKKNSTTYYSITNTNAGLTQNIQFTTPFISNGTDTLTITINCLSGSATYSILPQGTSSTVSIIHIA